MTSDFPTALPAARTPDPREAPTLRWGIVGTGWIAAQWLDSVRAHTTQQVAAVGSRTLPRAEAFATDHDVPRAHGTYEGLVADPDVDVVYVATPHNVHHSCAIMALEAGKHVLIEKPMALNTSQVDDIAEVARRNGLFCMEAMWTLFLPKFDVIDQVLGSGALGDVHTVIADYGEHFAADHRIMRADLAGGPLLDLGTYLVMLATHVLGVPDRVQATGQPAPSGVNGQVGALLTTGTGAQAVLHTTLFSNTPTAATLAGTGATLRIDGLFNMPGGFTLESADGTRRLRYDEPAVRHDSLHYQVADVARRIASGEHESPVRTLASTRDTMGVLDEIRRQIGVVFDGEQ